MKIIVFNARQDEEKAYHLYKQQHPEIELVIYNEVLDEKTASYIDPSFDAVCVSQVKEIPESVYRHIGECDIKVFATRSAGFDMYRLDLLKELGIRFVRVPAYSPNAIAEYALFGALYFSRNNDLIQQNVAQGDLRWQPSIVSNEVRKKTVGIIGTGNIGRNAARLFKGIGANVIGYDVFKNEEALQYLTYVDSVEELVEQSDIISLHVPATKENHHLFNEAMFKRMKSHAILVNTSRGALVDSEALLNALDQKLLRAAVLDVYEFEGPYVNKQNNIDSIEDATFKKLLSRTDVLYSPHIAFYTETAIENLVHIALDGAIKVLNGETDLYEEVVL